MEDYQPRYVTGVNRQNEMTCSRTCLIVVGLIAVSLADNPELDNIKHFLWILLLNHVLVTVLLCTVLGLYQNASRIVNILSFFVISAGLAWINYWTYYGIHCFFKTDFEGEKFIQLIILLVLIGEVFSLIVFDILYCSISAWVSLLFILICLNRINHKRRTVDIEGVPFAGETDVICAICKELLEKDNLSVSLKCNKNHVFHEECIKVWLYENPICPICRASAF